LISFYKFSREYAELVIHDDGTFTKADILFIRKLFPWAKIIKLFDADQQLMEKGFAEQVIKLRHAHKLLIKAIDFHFIESKKNILIIDTDIFIINQMNELWDRIIDGEQLIFNEDLNPAYGSAKELLEKVLNTELRCEDGPYINTGLIVLPASTLRQEKIIIEKYCLGFKDESFQRPHCIEQGFIANFLDLKRFKKVPLSDTYKIIGNNDSVGVKWLKAYDLLNNSESVNTIHLCGWDKLGKNFQHIKKGIFRALDLKNKYKVAFCPRSILDWPNPFWRITSYALKSQGIEVFGLRFTFLNLIFNIGKIKILHFHYIYPDMPSNKYSKLPKRFSNLIFNVSSWCQGVFFCIKIKLARLLNYKIIYTAHNIIFHEKMGSIYNKNLNCMYRLADLIVVMGEHDKKEIEKYVPQEKIKLVPFFSFVGIYDSLLSTHINTKI
jgi:hypothetical protein